MEREKDRGREKDRERETQRNTLVENIRTRNKKICSLEPNYEKP
jgi:hypothetical protein